MILKRERPEKDNFAFKNYMVVKEKEIMWIFYNGKQTPLQKKNLKMSFHIIAFQSILSISYFFPI